MTQDLAGPKRRADPASERPSASDSSDPRQRVVDAAEIRFARAGFYGASIRDIATALGLTKAAVMHHFPSKAALYAAVLERIGVSLDTIGEAARQATGTEREQLSRFIGLYLDWSIAHPDYSHIILRELLDNAGRAGHSGRWYLADFTNAMAALIRRGQKRGVVRAGHPVLFLEMLFGAASYHLAAVPTKRRIIGDVAAAQSGRQFRDDMADAIGRAWFTDAESRAE